MDKLTERLAAACRVALDNLRRNLASEEACGQPFMGDDEHEAIAVLTAALAAYDERVAAVAVPEPEPRAFKPGDRVVLARPDRMDLEDRGLEAGMAGEVIEVDHDGWPRVRLDGQRRAGYLFSPEQLEREKPAQPDPAISARLEALEARVAAMTAPTPRPSVGRRVRSRGGDGTSAPAAQVLTITEMTKGWPGTKDGKDYDGDYWAVDGKGAWQCIGKPGIDFEFID